MKRLALCCVALALTVGALGACSKTDTPAPIAAGNVPGANVDVNKIQNDAAKCATLLTGYSGLFAPLAASGSDADIQKAVKTLEDMKASVPDNIKTDLDSLENGIKNAKGVAALGTYLSSADFQKANTEVTNYFTTQCSKVGS